MTVLISRSALDQILAETARDPSIETCGLLLGSTGRIERILPAENVAEDPARMFEIDPAALIAAHRSAREGGATILGHYHSHPSGNPEPSVTDAAQAAADDALWLICAQGQLSLWRASTEGLHGRFQREQLVEA